MTEAEETVDDLNSEKWDTVFLFLPADCKTDFNLNKPAEHNWLQNPC